MNILNKNDHLQTFIKAIVAFLIAFIIIAFLNGAIDTVRGQERIVIREHKTSSREKTATGGVFTMTGGVPYRIEQDNDKVYYISRGDTIAVSFNVDKSKYVVNTDGAITGKFKNIKNKKIEYNIESSLDIELIGNDIFFKKNGESKAKFWFSDSGWKDKNKKNVKKDSIRQVGNKVTLSFADTVENSETDSLVWQPSAAQGKDVYVLQENGTTNYGNDVVLYGGMNDLGERIIFLWFNGWIDSIGTGKSIDSALISLYDSTGQAGTVQLHVVPLTATAWARGTGGTPSGDTVTYDNHPDSLTVKFSSDTLSASNDDGLWWTWHVKDMFIDYYNEVRVDSGQAIVDVAPAGANYETFRSSNDGNTLAHPKLRIYYTPTTTDEQTGILKSPLNGTIVKSVEDGTIKRKVNYP